MLFKSSSGSISCTQVPNFEQLPGKDIYLCDTPGFGDSNIDLEFPNQTLIHEVVKHANRVVICIVLRGSSIESQRGASYLAIMTSILRMLSKDGVNASKAFIVPLINLAGNFRSERQLETALRRPIDFLKQKAQAIQNS